MVTVAVRAEVLVLAEGYTLTVVPLTVAVSQLSLATAVVSVVFSTVQVISFALDDPASVASKLRLVGETVSDGAVASTSTLVTRTLTWVW